MSRARLDEARKQLAEEHAWDAIREQRVLQGARAAWREAETRRGGGLPVARGRRVLALAAVVPVAVLVVALAVAWRRAPRVAVAPLVGDASADASSATTWLADGSRVVHDGEIRTEEDTATAARVVQLRGSAFYDVAHRRERAFVVQAADVRIRVRGTRFRVVLDDAWVAVNVEQGRVEVDDGARVAELVTGESLRVRAWRAREAAQATEPSAEGPASPEAAPSPSARGRGTARGGGGGGRGVDALLAEANAARANGELERAADLLRAAAAQAPDRARKAVALFALGRVERARGRAAAAAAAFESASAMAPTDALADDALADAVDARAVVDAAGAHRLAIAYMRRFPAGAHVDRVEPLAR